MGSLAFSHPAMPSGITNTSVYPSSWAPGAHMAAVSARPGAVEHQRRGLVGRQLAGIVAVRVEVLGARDMAALPAPLAVVVEDEEAGLAESRRDLRGGELTDIRIPASLPV